MTAGRPPLALLLALLLAPGGRHAAAAGPVPIPGAHPLSWKPTPAPLVYHLEETRQVDHVSAAGARQRTVYAHRKVLERASAPAPEGRLAVTLCQRSATLAVNGVELPLAFEPAPRRWILEPSGKEWSESAHKALLRERISLVFPPGPLEPGRVWRATAKPDEDFPFPVRTIYRLEGFFEQDGERFARIRTTSLSGRRRAADGTFARVSSVGRIHFSLDGFVIASRSRLRFSLESPAPDRNGNRAIHFDILTRLERRRDDPGSGPPPGPARSEP